MGHILSNGGRFAKQETRGGGAWECPGGGEWMLQGVKNVKFWRQRELLRVRLQALVIFTAIHTPLVAPVKVHRRFWSAAERWPL
jgi:hypothetical protein